MGLFDRFKGGAKGEKKSSPAAKWADRIEKRAQNYDRQEAIQALADLGTREAAEILLKRFTFHIDPSITDQEEMDAAFRGILRSGQEAIEPVREHAAKAESLAWPEELLRWLAPWDTEYAKFVDPKVQILAELEEHRHPQIREQVERFLEDVNEPARFHSVSALLAQDDAAAAPALARLLADEESVRVRNRIADGLSTRAWSLPEETRAAARNMLPPAYSLDSAGRIIKR
jgi:HEAT repeat protein